MPPNKPDAETLPLSGHPQLLIEYHGETSIRADELPRMTSWTLCRFNLPLGSDNYMGRLSSPAIRLDPVRAPMCECSNETTILDRIKNLRVHIRALIVNADFWGLASVQKILKAATNHRPFGHRILARSVVHPPHNDIADLKAVAPLT